MSYDSREKLLGGTRKDRKTEKQRRRDTERQKEEGRRVRIKEQERRDGNEKNCSLGKQKNKGNKRESIPKTGKGKYIDTHEHGCQWLCAHERTHTHSCSGLCPGFVSSSLCDSAL